VKLSRVTIAAPGATLAGILYAPDGTPRAQAVVLAHGYTASKETMDLLAGYLCGRGYSCVTFDFRGHKLGGSTGSMTGAEDALADLRAAADFARDRLGAPRLVLVGHSMGGLAALVVAAERADVSCSVAIAVGARPSHGFATPVGRALHVQRADYVEGLDTEPHLAQLDAIVPRVTAVRCPALVVAARSDVIVSVEDVRSLAGLVPGAELVEVASGHQEAPERARGIVANWIASREARVESRE